MLALLPEALGPLLSGSCLQSILRYQSLLAIAVLALLPKVLSLHTMTSLAGRVTFALCIVQGRLIILLSQIITASCTAAHACKHTCSKSIADSAQMPQLCAWY